PETARTQQLNTGDGRAEGILTRPFETAIHGRPVAEPALIVDRVKPQQESDLLRCEPPRRPGIIPVGLFQVPHRPRQCVPPEGAVPRGRLVRAVPDRLDGWAGVTRHRPQPSGT